MRRIKLLILAVTSLTAITATTQIFASMPLPTGWYLEGNAGSTKASSVSYGNSLSYSTPGLGLNINAGYKFIPYFAAELGYTSYSKAKIKANTTYIAQDVHKAMYLAAKGMLPVVDSGFELFAKLGVARVNSHITITNPSYVSVNEITVNAGSHSSTAAYFGVGGDYSFMPNLSMNLQWNRARGNTSVGNLDLYSLGAAWIFG